MKTRKVIVVGNSHTILDNEFGNEIDKFDIVIRINDFRLNGFEKHVGTKTTIWCTTMSNELIDILNSPQFKQDLKITDLDIKQVWFRRYFDHFQNRFDTFKKYIDLDTCRIELLNYHGQGRIVDGVKCKWIGNTGTVAIIEAVKRYEDVTIIGHNLSAKDRELHYFSRKNKIKGRTPDHSAERGLIKHWIETGKVKEIKGN